MTDHNQSEETPTERRLRMQAARERSFEEIRRRLRATGYPVNEADPYGLQDYAHVGREPFASVALGAILDESIFADLRGGLADRLAIAGARELLPTFIEVYRTCLPPRNDDDRLLASGLDNAILRLVDRKKDEQLVLDLLRDPSLQGGAKPLLDAVRRWKRKDGTPVLMELLDAPFGVGEEARQILEERARKKRGPSH